MVIKRPITVVAVVLLSYATGTKRFDSEKAGDREVQRTMLELLNQLDGFQPNHDIKVTGDQSISHSKPSSPFLGHRPPT